MQRALEALGGTLKDDVIRRMSQEVDFKHRPVNVLAKEFLASVGL